VDECKPLLRGDVRRVGRHGRRPVLAVAGRRAGEAVQLEPIKSKSKSPGTKRLKLKHDNLVSSFAFNFNLGHYTLGPDGDGFPRAGSTAQNKLDFHDQLLMLGGDWVVAPRLLARSVHRYTLAASSSLAWALVPLTVCAYE